MPTTRRSTVVDSQIPDDLLYTDDHRWVRIEEGTAIIGITHKAQKDLGDVVFIELAEKGSSCDIGDEICSIESIKTTSEVLAPLSGRIAELNERFERSLDCYFKNGELKSEFIEHV